MRSRRAISRCAPASANEVGMYLAGRWYRLTLQPQLAAKAAQAKRSGRAAADHAPHPQHHRAAFRHHRSAHRQAHRLRRRRPRARRAGAARFLRADGGRVRALSDADAATSWRSPTPARSCRRNPPGSNRSSPTAWSATCWIDACSPAKRRGGAQMRLARPLEKTLDSASPLNDAPRGPPPSLCFALRRKED